MWILFLFIIVLSRRFFFAITVGRKKFRKVLWNFWTFLFASFLRWRCRAVWKTCSLTKILSKTLKMLFSIIVKILRSLFDWVRKVLLLKYNFVFKKWRSWFCFRRKTRRRRWFRSYVVRRKRLEFTRGNNKTAAVSSVERKREKRAEILRRSSSPRRTTTKSVLSLKNKK